MPSASGASRSCRISARPGPTYQSACAVVLAARHTRLLALDFTPRCPAISCTDRADREVAQRAGARRPRVAVSTGSDTRIVGRRVLFAALVLLTIAALLALAAYALSAGGFGVADALLLLLLRR